VCKEPVLVTSQGDCLSPNGEKACHPYGRLQGLVDKRILRPSGPGRLSLLATHSHGIQGRLSRELEKKLRPIINPRNRLKVEFAAQVILFNCRACSRYQEMAPPGIRVVVVQPRAHDEYRPSRKYGTKNLSAVIFPKVLDRMKDLGLLGLKVERPLGNLRSSYWPTRALHTQLKEGVSKMEVKQFCKEVIILKDEDKNLLDYHDTRRTIAMRKGVKALNASNSVHQIDLQVPENLTEILEVSAFFGEGDTTDEGSRQIWTIRTEKVRYMISVQGGEDCTTTTAIPRFQQQQATSNAKGKGEGTTNNRRLEDDSIPVHVSILYGLTGHYDPEKKLIRIPLNPLLPYQRNFCQADWTKGGRWYASVQNIPKVLRPLITMDDEQTVELDYNALHARFLLARAGVVPQGDPYTVNLKGWENAKSLRDAIKLAFQVFLNVKSRQGAITALYKCIDDGKLKLEQGFNPGDLLDAFLATHPCLEPFMCSDKGIKGVDLQNLDAEIAANIFKRFPDTDRPVIGLHDSFIVKSTDEGFLREAMVDAYRDRVGQDPVMKRIQGISGFKRQESLTAADAHGVLCA
jgi:hypothetical protein